MISKPPVSFGNQDEGSPSDSKNDNDNTPDQTEPTSSYDARSRSTHREIVNSTDHEKTPGKKPFRSLFDHPLGKRGKSASGRKPSSENKTVREKENFLVGKGKRQRFSPDCFQSEKSNFKENQDFRSISVEENGLAENLTASRTPSISSSDTGSSDDDSYRMPPIRIKPKQENDELNDSEESAERIISQMKKISEILSVPDKTRPRQQPVSFFLIVESVSDCFLFFECFQNTPDMFSSKEPTDDAQNSTLKYFLQFFLSNFQFHFFFRFFPSENFDSKFPFPPSDLFNRSSAESEPANFFKTSNELPAEGKTEFSLESRDEQKFEQRKHDRKETEERHKQLIIIRY